MSSGGVVRVGALRGEVADAYRDERVLATLHDAVLHPENYGAAVLSKGPDRVTRVTLPVNGRDVPLAIKYFAPRNWVQDRMLAARGSAARRSWLAARTMTEREVATPGPVAFLEEWQAGRLKRSAYVSEYDDQLTSFRDELIRLFRHRPDCGDMMVLLALVARAVGRLHDARIQHRDMGNQNILLRRTGAGAWADVQFVDLNRSRFCDEPLRAVERAYDVSRIHLPSDLLRIFMQMYFDGPVPPDFQAAEQRFRRRFKRHSRSRVLRHPLRTYRRRRTRDPAIRYPGLRDMWLWDARTAQPVNVVRRPERKKLVPMSNHLKVGWSSLKMVPGAYRAYRRLLSEAYREPVDLSGRVAVAVEPTPDSAEREFALLNELGRVPVLLRYYRHQGEEAWARVSGWVRRLREQGHGVGIALVQDRQAVAEPRLWRSFVSRVLDDVHEVAEWVELGHAINRVKWGLWTLKDYAGLMEAVADVGARYPGTRFAGPAVIDFEYHYLAAALDALPPGLKFQALSHHLYVDRRGAPENEQGGFSTLEKLALARAIARCSPATDDRLVVSEVNWPLVDGGIYSPVGAPYLYPGQQLASPPGVTEDAYADYMLRYLLIALCSGMAERVCWWRLVHRGFGLVDDTDADAWRKRVAFGMLKHFLAQVGTAVFEARTVAPDGVQVFRFRRADAHVAVAYTPGKTVRYEPDPGCRAITDALGNPVARDAGGVDVGGRPVYFVGPS